MSIEKERERVSGRAHLSDTADRGTLESETAETFIRDVG